MPWTRKCPCTNIQTGPVNGGGSHDSFLIDNRHSNELIALMNDAFTEIVEETTKTSIQIESLMKVTTYYDTLMKHDV